MVEQTLFEKILAKDIPGEILFEDEMCFVLKDINPQAPVHFLVIPKKAIPRIGEMQKDQESLMGHLLYVAKDQASKHSLDEGYRIVINNGRMGGESVPHLHVHVLGGRQLHWPPG